MPVSRIPATGLEFSVPEAPNSTRLLTVGPTGGGVAFSTDMLQDPYGVFLVHFKDRIEEVVVRYFMESAYAEKHPFRYTIPRDPAYVQLSST